MTLGLKTHDSFRKVATTKSDIGRRIRFTSFHDARTGNRYFNCADVEREDAGFFELVSEALRRRRADIRRKNCYGGIGIGHALKSEAYHGVKRVVRPVVKPNHERIRFDCDTQEY